MWQNSGNQRGNPNPLPYLGEQAQIDNGDQQQMMRVENVSGSGRLSRGVSYASMVSGAAVSATVGLPIAMDPGVRRFETGEASTSRMPQMGSTQFENSFLSQEIVSQARSHNIEMGSLIRNYNNTIFQGIKQKIDTYWLSAVYTLHQQAAEEIMNKQAEVDNANGRNSELEARISKLSSDNQILYNLVRQLQALGSKLKADLRNVLSQKAAAATPPLAVESCGDNDNVLTPFIANDEQSCYFVEDASVESQEKVPRRLICKVCLVKEISFVILHCRHLCLCEECESKVDICPVCYSLKSGTAQIFIP